MTVAASRSSSILAYSWSYLKKCQLNQQSFWTYAPVQSGSYPTDHPDIEDRFPTEMDGSLGLPYLNLMDG